MEFLKNVRYRAYRAEKGWDDWAELGHPSEGIGTNSEITAFEMQCDAAGAIESQCYLEKDGWSGVCGDETNKQRICALRFRIMGMQGYHIFYRVRDDGGEWSRWSCDFEVAGDMNGSSFVTSVELAIGVDEPHLSYRAYIQSKGWTNFVGDDQVVGLEGKGHRIEAVFLRYSGPGRLMAQARVESKGWMEEVGTDTICGTRCEDLRLEAIRIRLQDADHLHVSYRVCIKGQGWQGWVRDGEEAGTVNGFPIEAVRIRIGM